MSQQDEEFEAVAGFFVHAMDTEMTPLPRRSKKHCSRWQ